MSEFAANVNKNNGTNKFVPKFYCFRCFLRFYACIAIAWIGLEAGPLLAPDVAGELVPTEDGGTEEVDDVAVTLVESEKKFRIIVICRTLLS